MAFVKTWSEADLGAQRPSTIDDHIEDTRYGVRERANVEHIAYADETSKSDVWRHRKAASRTNYGLAANKPTTEATGRVDGARYRETDTGLIKYWDSAEEEWTTEVGSLHTNLTTTYTTGTVTVTNASATITGASTLWAANVTAGDVFLGPDGEYYNVSVVVSDTSITLDRVYDGSTAAGQSYTISLNSHPAYYSRGGGTVNGPVAMAETLTMAAAIAMGANKITGLAAGDANGDAVRYEQVIGVMAKMKIGTYTGDGAATQAVTGVGFQPELMILWTQGTVIYVRFKTSADGTYTKNSNGGYFEDEIISLDADGFTVGDGTGGGEDMNGDTVVHTYIAVRDSA